MPGKLKATNEQLTESYGRLQNIWLVAKEFDMCGQSVHERLVKLGICNKIRKYTVEDHQYMRDNYQELANSGKLKEMALKFGTTVQTLCKIASLKGVETSYKRSKRGMAGVMATTGVPKWVKTPHPKGMLGKKHTEENKIKYSAISKRIQKEINDSGRRGGIVMKTMKTKMKKYGTIVSERHKVTWKQGWRNIGGIDKYYRSRWEANYARYLEFLKEHNNILKWEHEPKTFWFEGVKRGCVSYLPDFKVTENNGEEKYHEVKGWMDDRSKTKIERMAKYYPEVTLIIISAKWFKENGRKLKGLIKDWEQ